MTAAIAYSVLYVLISFMDNISSTHRISRYAKPPWSKLYWLCSHACAERLLDSPAEAPGEVMPLLNFARQQEYYPFLANYWPVQRSYLRREMLQWRSRWRADSLYEAVQVTSTVG